MVDPANSGRCSSPQVPAHPERPFRLRLRLSLPFHLPIQLRGDSHRPWSCTPTKAWQDTRAAAKTSDGRGRGRNEVRSGGDEAAVVGSTRYLTRNTSLRQPRSYLWWQIGQQCSLVVESHFVARYGVRFVPYPKCLPEGYDCVFNLVRRNGNTEYDRVLARIND